LPRSVALRVDERFDDERRPGVVVVDGSVERVRGFVFGPDGELEDGGRDVLDDGKEGVVANCIDRTNRQ
jgi:hypothetical protein